MSQEQIYKQIPKQRRSQERYEQPFPVPELPVDEVLASADVTLELIDEVTNGSE